MHVQRASNPTFLGMVGPVLRGLCKLDFVGDAYIRRQVVTEVLATPLERAACTHCQPVAAGTTPHAVYLSSLSCTSVLAAALASSASEKMTRLRRFVVQVLILPYFQQVVAPLDWASIVHNMRHRKTFGHTSRILGCCSWFACLYNACIAHCLKGSTSDLVCML